MMTMTTPKNESSKIHLTLVRWWNSGETIRLCVRKVESCRVENCARRRIRCNTIKRERKTNERIHFIEPFVRVCARGKYNDPYDDHDNDDDDVVIVLVVRFWFSGALYSNNIKIFTYPCVWLVLSYHIMYHRFALPLTSALSLSPFDQTAYTFYLNLPLKTTRQPKRCWLSTKGSSRIFIHRKFEHFIFAQKEKKKYFCRRPNNRRFGSSSKCFIADSYLIVL